MFTMEKKNKTPERIWKLGDDLSTKDILPTEKICSKCL